MSRTFPSLPFLVSVGLTLLILQILPESQHHRGAAPTALSKGVVVAGLHRRPPALPHLSHARCYSRQEVALISPPPGSGLGTCFDQQNMTEVTR